MSPTRRDKPAARARRSPGSRYRDLQEQAFAANLEIPRQGLAIYTFGNASAFDPARGVMAIKPSGVSYAELRPRDLVVVDLEGKIVEGKLNPSSDTRTHLVLYAAFPGVGGIAHTHSTHATGWAQAGLPLPIYGTTHADHLAEDVPCTEVMSAEAVQGDYETETGRQIVECFRGRDPGHVPMVLVAGHGPFTWGANAAAAVYHAAVLEQLAHMAFVTRTLAPGAERLPPHLVRRHYERKHGSKATYGQAGPAVRR
ncbi:MAG: L-ribulose-5-phosphate 4-epimerase AraD [Anaeromyxobacter sp.]